MKIRLIIGLLLASTVVLAGPRVAIGFGIGVSVAPSYYVAPAPAAVYTPPAYVAPAYAPPPAYVPPIPAPGYQWIGGYWYFSGGHRFWRSGYWAPPRVHAYVGRGWRYR